VASYADQVRRLRELGPRPSGSVAHRALIEDVAGELRALGYVVHRDRHTFKGWEVSRDNVSLRIASARVPLSSEWPYSGSTDAQGVTAPLVLLDGIRKNWKAAAGKIAVIDVSNIDVPAKLFINSWSGRLPFESASNPVIGSELAGTDLAKARRAGVLGVVATWSGLSDGAAAGQYLPFTRDYQGVPAVWAPESQRSAIRAAARRGETATLVLPARTIPGATMDTLWAVSQGGNAADEAVLVVTHSDGGNVVEENGHIGLLALARDAARNSHDRTIVFVYTAGHLRIPAVTDRGQATTAWLDAHPELWSPDSDGLTAVGGLVIEHLGAKHFRVNHDTGEYGPDGSIEPELLYASTPQLADLAERMWEGEAGGGPITVKPGALVHLGEGEPLFEHGVPALALVTGPDYLLAEIDEDMVDLPSLTRQVDSFRRVLQYLAGPTDKSAFGVVRRPGNLRKLLAGLRAVWYVVSRR